MIFVFLISIMTISAQSKVGYIDSRKLLQESTEGKNIKDKIEKLKAQYEGMQRKMRQEYEDLKNEFDAQKLLMSEKRKQEKLAEIQKKGQEIAVFEQTKLLYPNGEFHQKVNELQDPLVQKILKAVEAVSKEKGLDIVFDNVNSIILYTSDAIDYTDDVKAYLEKGTNQ